MVYLDAIRGDTLDSAHLVEGSFHQHHVPEHRRCELLDYKAM